MAAVFGAAVTATRFVRAQTTRIDRVLGAPPVPAALCAVLAQDPRVAATHVARGCAAVTRCAGCELWIPLVMSPRAAQAARAAVRPWLERRTRHIREYFGACEHNINITVLHSYGTKFLQVSIRTATDSAAHPSTMATIPPPADAKAKVQCERRAELCADPLEYDDTLFWEALADVFDLHPADKRRILHDLGNLELIWAPEMRHIVEHAEDMEDEASGDDHDEEEDDPEPKGAGAAKERGTMSFYRMVGMWCRGEYIRERNIIDQTFKYLFCRRYDVYCTDDEPKVPRKRTGARLRHLQHVKRTYGTGAAYLSRICSLAHVDPEDHAWMAGHLDRVFRQENWYVQRARREGTERDEDEEEEDVDTTDDEADMEEKEKNKMRDGEEGEADEPVQPHAASAC